MSLRQRLRLELEDGTVVEPTYDGRDLRAWEGRTGKSALMESMTLSMLTYLGWNAGRRDGSLNGSFPTFESFDAVCVDVRGVVDDVEEPDAADPSPTPHADTPPTASDG